jgi:hypothetical protein
MARRCLALRQGSALDPPGAEGPLDPLYLAIVPIRLAQDVPPGTRWSCARPRVEAWLMEFEKELTNRAGS